MTLPLGFYNFLLDYSFLCDNLREDKPHCQITKVLSHVCVKVIERLDALEELTDAHNKLFVVARGGGYTEYDHTEIERQAKIEVLEKAKQLLHDGGMEGPDGIWVVSMTYAWNRLDELKGENNGEHKD